MALPNDESIQTGLMQLLIKQPGLNLESRQVYSTLAELFPSLTPEEKTLPYQNSVSHWANRVQFTVLHLRNLGWLRSPSVGERGVWEVTPKGKIAWENIQRTGDQLLKELDDLS